MDIPNYIEDRIRRHPPDDSVVVPFSTPVVAFGDVQKSHVATLGLNPSDLEFEDKSGRLLVGADRRLATLRSLGIKDLSAAPSSAIEAVLQDCNTYFDRNPYTRWFNKFESLLKICQASFYRQEGLSLACHLDLVQWATKPKWGKLPSRTKSDLIREDAVFLRTQLQNENIKTLLVNGNGVWEALRASFKDELSYEKAEPIEGYLPHRCAVFVGQIATTTRVVAWSANLQSSHGVGENFMAALRDRLRQILQ